MPDDKEMEEVLRQRREEAMRRADAAMSRRRPAAPPPVPVRASVWERLRRWWRARGAGE